MSGGCVVYTGTFRATRTPFFRLGGGGGGPTWGRFSARLSYAARAMIAQPRPRPPRRLNWNSSEAARDQFGL